MYAMTERSSLPRKAFANVLLPSRILDLQGCVYANPNNGIICWLEYKIEIAIIEASALVSMLNTKKKNQMIPQKEHSLFQQ